MNAISVRHPVTGIDYLWPKAKNKVTASDQRRANTQTVPSADGAQDVYGQNPFPRAATTLTIGFRVTPRAHGTTFDALRRTLNLAIDHGLPQRITFNDDAGKVWFITGKLVGKNLDADENRQWWADWEVTYLCEEALAYAPLSGVNTWGAPGLKWGQAGLKWGATPHSYALTAASHTFTVANPDATAETRDMQFLFTGPWGPATIATPGGASYIQVTNESLIDLNTGAAVSFSIYENLPTGTSLTVDCGTSGVYKTVMGAGFGAAGGGRVDEAGVDTVRVNAASGPVSLSTAQSAEPRIGTVKKVSPLQFGLMRFRPNGENVLTFTVVGGLIASPNGTLIISWRPKGTLA